MTANRIRVGIAVETAIVREAVSRLLAGETGVEVVGLAATPADARRLAREADPDVLLLEIGRDSADVGELLSALGTARSSLRVLLLSHGPSALAPTEAVLLGAWGVVRPDAGVEELVKAVRAVASGEHWIGRSEVAAILEHLRSARRGGGASGGPLARVTAREREIALGVGSGESNREIATRLRISEATVKARLTKLYKKLEVSNRAAVALLVAGGTVARGPGRRGKHGRR